MTGRYAEDNPIKQAKKAKAAFKQAYEDTYRTQGLEAAAELAPAFYNPTPQEKRVPITPDRYARPQIPTVKIHLQGKTQRIEATDPQEMVKAFEKLVSAIGNKG